MSFPQWDCIDRLCSPLCVDPGSAIAITFGATLCQGVWWLARAFSCYTEITRSRLWYTHITMDQQYHWQYESYWCINAGFFNCGVFTLPEPLRGRVTYGNTYCDISLGSGIAADSWYMVTYSWWWQDSLHMFQILDVTLGIETFQFLQVWLMESERHLRFQTGAVPRQGVWPTSQQDHTDPLSTLVFVLASGKRFCYFYMTADWLDHCYEFKTEWDVFHSVFQTNESSHFMDLMMRSFHTFMTVLHGEFMWWCMYSCIFTKGMLLSSGMRLVKAPFLQSGFFHTEWWYYLTYPTGLWHIPAQWWRYTEFAF